MSVRPFTALMACALLGFLCACKTEVASDSTGAAYIAPATVNLRSDVSSKTNNVAVLKHGDRVQVVDVKRRFVQVKTDKGVVGWLDSTQLLSPEQMRQLQKDREHALTLPSEGTATVFDALNVHLEPSRQSPSFTRIAEGAPIQVLAHKLEPKANDSPKAPVFTLDRPQPARKERKRREARTQTFRLPPKPSPPKPPANIDELSAAHVEAPKPPPVKTPQPAKPVVLEDWSLVRTKDNQVGWVLSRNLIMSIPDEVAQYAEGKRITSYFSLGSVTDEESGTTKHNWLWTTLSEPAAYDFDGWRVFLWNRRRHRYETSYRMRDVEGHFPVHVDGSDFTLLTKDDDGKMRVRTYNFDGVRVHLTRTEDYKPNQPDNAKTSAQPAQKDSGRPNWLRRLFTKLRGKH